MNASSAGEVRSMMEHYGEVSKIGLKKNKAIVAFAAAAHLDRALTEYPGPWTLDPAAPRPPPSSSPAAAAAAAPPPAAAGPAAPARPLPSSSASPAAAAAAAAGPEARTVVVKWKGAPAPPSEEQLRVALEEYGDIYRLHITKKKALCMYGSQEHARAAVAQYPGPWQLGPAAAGAGGGAATPPASTSRRPSASLKMASVVGSEVPSQQNSPRGQRSPALSIEQQKKIEAAEASPSGQDTATAAKKPSRLKGLMRKAAARARPKGQPPAGGEAAAPPLPAPAAAVPGPGLGEAPPPPPAAASPTAAHPAPPPLLGPEQATAKLLEDELQSLKTFQHHSGGGVSNDGLYVSGSMESEEDSAFKRRTFSTSQEDWPVSVGNRFKNQSEMSPTRVNGPEDDDEVLLGTRKEFTVQLPLDEQGMLSPTGGLTTPHEQKSFPSIPEDAISPGQHQQSNTKLNRRRPAQRSSSSPPKAQSPLKAQRDGQLEVMQARIATLERMLESERQYSLIIQAQKEEAHRGWVEEVTRVRMAKLEAEEETRELRAAVGRLEGRLAAQEAEAAALRRAAGALDEAERVAVERAQRDVASTTIMQERIISALQKELESASKIKDILQTEVRDLQTQFGEAVRDLVQWRNRAGALETLLGRHGLAAEARGADVETAHQLGRLLLETRFVRVVDDPSAHTDENTKTDSMPMKGDIRSLPEQQKASAPSEDEMPKKRSERTDQTSGSPQSTQDIEEDQNQMRNTSPPFQTKGLAKEQVTKLLEIKSELREFGVQAYIPETAPAGVQAEDRAAAESQARAERITNSREVYQQALQAQEDLSARLERQLQETRMELESLKIGEGTPAPHDFWADPNRKTRGLGDVRFDLESYQAHTGGDTVAQRRRAMQKPSSHHHSHWEGFAADGQGGGGRGYRPATAGLRDWVAERQRVMAKFPPPPPAATG